MAKKIKEIPKHTCRDCKHATDFHSEALDGHMILCRCSYHKWSKFLDYDHCENFLLKR